MEASLILGRGGELRGAVGPAPLEQREAVDVERQRVLDGLRVADAREELVDVVGIEVRELEVERRELDVRLAVVAGREEEVLASEHGADLVELRLADAMDALAHHRVRERPRLHAVLEVVVDVAVERSPPHGAEVVSLGARDEDDRGRQVRRLLPELGLADDPEERGALDRRSSDRAGPGARTRRGRAAA